MGKPVGSAIVLAEIVRPLLTIRGKWDRHRPRAWLAGGTRSAAGTATGWAGNAAMRAGTAAGWAGTATGRAGTAAGRAGTAAV